MTCWTPAGRGHTARTRSHVTSCAEVHYGITNSLNVFLCGRSEWMFVRRQRFSTAQFITRLLQQKSLTYFSVQRFTDTSRRQLLFFSGTFVFRRHVGLDRSTRSCFTVIFDQIITWLFRLENVTNVPPKSSDINSHQKLNDSKMIKKDVYSFSNMYIWFVN